MAGTLLAAGVISTAAALSIGLAAVGGAATVSQRTAAAADVAALAASDVASGAVQADSAACTVAARVAEASGARLVSCDLRGPLATVQVGSSYAGLAVVVRARAGPPE